ncbi:MAG: NAD(P)-binding domain-containing protein [Sulfuricaulis sp.]
MNVSSEVAIIGGGPFGLSIAANLRAHGVSFRIFGSPMQTWCRQMPKGMLLKSDGFASNFYDPDGHFTLKHFCAQQGIAYDDQRIPVSLETFCAYGLAFQQRLVPELEDRKLINLIRSPEGFILHLDNGQVVTSRKVVLAIGIHHFQNVPDQLAHLPADVCSHSSRYRDIAQFQGRDVTVMGGGASALDLAGLLYAGGAAVRLVARRQSIQIHSGPGLKLRSMWQRIRHPKSGLGPGLRSRIVANAPLLFHYLPQKTRLRIVQNLLGPSGGWFIRDQVVGKVPLLLGYTLQSAEVGGNRVHLRFEARDGAKREVITDHVVAATGYRIDLRRLTFINAELSKQLRSVNFTPILTSNFESSIPGLYFVGSMSANSFGPVMRFVFGVSFTARRLCAHLAQPSLRPAPKLAADWIRGLPATCSPHRVLSEFQDRWGRNRLR